jgi:hypothetical protein
VRYFTFYLGFRAVSCGQAWLRCSFRLWVYLNLKSLKADPSNGNAWLRCCYRCRSLPCFVAYMQGSDAALVGRDVLCARRLPFGPGTRQQLDVYVPQAAARQLRHSQQVSSRGLTPE